MLEEEHPGLKSLVDEVRLPGIPVDPESLKKPLLGNKGETPMC